MLEIEKTAAKVKSVKISRAAGISTEEARRTFAVRVAFTTTAEVASELAPTEDLRAHFWDRNGVPLMPSLWPLRVRSLLQNVAVKIYDSLAIEALELEACDLGKVEITPKLAGAALVELTIKGVTPEWAPGLGDRLWNMIGTPISLSAQAKQHELPLTQAEAGAALQAIAAGPPRTEEQVDLEAKLREEAAAHAASAKGRRRGAAGPKPRPGRKGRGK